MTSPAQVALLLSALTLGHAQSTDVLHPAGGCTCLSSWSWQGEIFPCGVCVNPGTSPDTLQLLNHGYECDSTDVYLGEYPTVAGCARACQVDSECHFFTYGLAEGAQGNKEGNCYKELTSSESCTEGFSADSYDFYSVDSSSTPWCYVSGDCGQTGEPITPGTAVLIEMGKECESEDEYLGTFDTLAECAAACQSISGCEFLIFGVASKAGLCYSESTLSASCYEGWEFDEYDFYRLEVVDLHWQYCEESLAEATTCMWENDGECDSGTYCPQGTDTHDCSESAECSGNFGSCKCPSRWVGDGTCHPSCNNFACSYDNGDCLDPSSQDEMVDDTSSLTCAGECNTSCACGWFHICSHSERSCPVAAAGISTNDEYDTSDTFKHVPDAGTFQHCNGDCVINIPAMVVSSCSFIFTLLCCLYCYHNGCSCHKTVSVSAISTPVDMMSPRLRSAVSHCSVQHTVVHAEPVPVSIPTLDEHHYAIQQAQIESLQATVHQLSAVTAARHWTVEDSTDDDPASQQVWRVSLPTPPPLRGTIRPGNDVNAANGHSESTTSMIVPGTPPGQMAIDETSSEDDNSGSEHHELSVMSV